MKNLFLFSQVFFLPKIGFKIQGVKSTLIITIRNTEDTFFSYYTICKANKKSKCQKCPANPKSINNPSIWMV